MKLHVKRRWFTPHSTIGELYVDGVKECFTLEDVVRVGPKVYGKTAIPEGTYRVILDVSARFKRIMPHILDVPGFDGIRMHPLNRPEETEGCIGVGLGRGPNRINSSRLAYDFLLPKLQAAQSRGELIEITITNVPEIGNANP